MLKDAGSLESGHFAGTTLFLSGKFFLSIYRTLSGITSSDSQMIPKSDSNLFKLQMQSKVNLPNRAGDAEQNEQNA